MEKSVTKGICLVDDFFGDILQNLLKRLITLLLFVTLLVTIGCSYIDGATSPKQSSENETELDNTPMKPLPKTETPLVLRTDFSNQSA